MNDKIAKWVRLIAIPLVIIAVLAAVTLLAFIDSRPNLPPGHPPLPSKAQWTVTV